MLEFDDIQHFLLTRAPALAARYEFLSFRDAAGGRAWVIGDQGDDSFGGVDARQRRPGQALGDGGFHLERPPRARTGRGFARVFSGGVQAGHGGAGGDARRHRRERPRTLGRRACEPRSACNRHSLCAGRGRARPLRRRSTRSSSPAAPASRSSPCSIFRPFRRSDTRMSISAIATGCRSRPSRETASNRRREPASL